MSWGVWTIINSSSWDLNYLIQTNGTWFITKAIVILFVFLRIIAIIRVAKDISARTQNTFSQIMCILLVTILSPILGLPLYVILRPIHYKRDKIPRREAQAMTLLPCYNCSALNLQDNHYCTNCGEPLKLKCKKCGHSCSYNHTYCEKCWWPNFDS